MDYPLPHLRRTITRLPSRLLFSIPSIYKYIYIYSHSVHTIAGGDKQVTTFVSGKYICLVFIEKRGTEGEYIGREGKARALVSPLSTVPISVAAV